MNLSKIKNIYMIGIKGVGMTMLAQFLSCQNYEISGSDVEEKFMTDEVLAKANIKVIEGFSESNIPDDTDLIIYSTAYNVKNNVELAKAMSSKTKTIEYAEALGEFFNSHDGIAVIGSHGKTTTTAWLGYILWKSGLEPKVLVGSKVKQFDGCSLSGKSDYMVAEVDEYQNKFKYFFPKAVILNNIDYDHPDFFPTPEDYKQVFIDFIGKISAKGFLVINLDDPIIRKIAEVNSKAKIISYAIKESADYVAYDIKVKDGRQYFKVKIAVEDEGDGEDEREGLLGDFSIQLPGKYNISNALAVIATCIELDIPLVQIREHLGDFQGTNRRMQVLGKFKGATIIDDYAHHPTEVKAALAGARAMHKNKKITVVFHPHTFTRTKALFNEFANSFLDADKVIVLDIYGSAREEQGGVSSDDLAKAIKQSGQENTIHISTLKKCEEYLRENIERDEIVILMGAGDVFRIGENLIKD